MDFGPEILCDKMVFIPIDVKIILFDNKNKYIKATNFAISVNFGESETDHLLYV